MERVEQLHPGAGAFNRDYVRIHPHNRLDDVIELGIAHVSMNLGFIGSTGRQGGSSLGPHTIGDTFGRNFVSDEIS